MTTARGRLKMVVEEAADFSETRPAGRLLKIEDDIRKAEDEGITLRWASGRELLTHREGKQLPRGVRADLVKTLGVSTSELNYRMQFAETFKTKEEVSTAVDTFGSWRDIRAKGLPKMKRTAKPTATPELTKKLREIKALLKRQKGQNLDEAQRALIDDVYDECTRLTEEVT